MYTLDEKVYFVTFRLADAIPDSQMQRLILAKQQWRAVHAPPLTERELDEYHDLFNRKIDKWLDDGYGGCVLKRPECNSIVTRFRCKPNSSR